MRNDGRSDNENRPVKITRNYLKFVEGSVLMEMGDTKVICTATIDEKVPSFMKDTGRGWLTAEYSMLPRSSQTRIQREVTRGKQGGRTHEIQRLIGRSLRAIMDLDKLGQRTIVIDCDVIQADGGTRTASITGAYIALSDSINALLNNGTLSESPIIDSIAAVSVGVVEDRPVLDLNYEEDSTAEVDMNVVMTGGGKFIEVQGTAEGDPFSQETLSSLLALATSGINDLTGLQSKALAL